MVTLSLACSYLEDYSTTRQALCGASDKPPWGRSRILTAGGRSP